MVGGYQSLRSEMITTQPLEHADDAGAVDFMGLNEECMFKVLHFVPAWDRLFAVERCCSPMRRLSKTPHLWGALTLRGVSIVKDDLRSRVQFLRFVDGIRGHLWGMQLIHVNIDMVADDLPEQLSLPNLRALTCVASWHRELRFVEALLLKLDAPSLRSLTVTGPATATLLRLLGDRAAKMGSNLQELAVTLLAGGSSSPEELRSAANYVSCKIATSASNLKRLKLQLDNRCVADIIGVRLIQLLPDLHHLEALCLRPLPRTWAEELVELSSTTSAKSGAPPLAEVELKFEDPAAPTLVLPLLVNRGALKELHLHSDSWTWSPLSPQPQILHIWLGNCHVLRTLALRDLRLDSSAFAEVVRSCPELQCLELISGGSVDSKGLQLLLESLPALEELRCFSSRKGTVGDSWTRGALTTLGLYGSRLRRLHLDGPGPCADARHYVGLAKALSIHQRLEHLELSAPIDITPPRGEGVWLPSKELAEIISSLPSLVRFNVDPKLCGSPEVIHQVLPTRLQNALPIRSLDPISVNA